MVRAREAAHAALVADLQASTWRLSVVDGRWRLARKEPGRPWRVLAASIAAWPDIDPAAERRRVVSWLRELLGHRSARWWRDYDAGAARARGSGDRIAGSAIQAGRSGQSAHTRTNRGRLVPPGRA